MKNSEIVGDRIVNRTSFRVRYANTDQMHIVWHGNYFEYFEVGRTELMRTLGFTYRQMEEWGTRLPLIEAQCRFLIPAMYDDEIIIESTIPREIGARLRLDYRVLRCPEETVLAVGHTIHAFQDIPTLRVVRPPAFFVEALRKGPLE